MSPTAFVQRVDQCMTAVGERLDALAAEFGEMKDAFVASFQELQKAVGELRERGEAKGRKEDREAAAPAGSAADADSRTAASPCLPASPSAPSPLAPVSAPGPDDPWQRAIFGPSLAADPSLVFYRSELLRGVLLHDAAAGALAGQLLVFQSAAAEKKPTLLKEIGEAFYRWRPKRSPGGAKLEQALAGWLQEACQQAGAANTIELVEPGQRFDAARHSAPQRGVEITAVHGWVVLRDNGKVYTKAAVAVK